MGRKKLSANYHAVEQPPQVHELVFQQYQFDPRIGGSSQLNYPALSAQFYHSNLGDKTLSREIARGADKAAEVLRKDDNSLD